MIAAAERLPDLSTSEPEPAGAHAPAEPTRSIEYLDGYSDGYRTAMSVLDEAAAFLSTTLRPADAVDLAAARADAIRRTDQGLTGEQLRARAYTSWDLPLPADLAEHGTDSHRRPAADVTEEAL